MSDEPKSRDNGADWTMPDPVFRTSQGRRPQGFKFPSGQEDVDTESPDLEKIDQDEIDTELPAFAEIPIDEEPLPIEAAGPDGAGPVKNYSPERGGSKRLITILIIVLTSAALAGLAVYLLDTGKV